MGGLFTNVLEVSFHGSIVILAVLVLRLVLKGAPRNTICLLWLLAAVRLLMPFQISSPMSLQPDLDTSIRVQTQITQENIIDVPISDETPSNAIPEDTSGWPDDVVVSTGDALSGDTTNTVVDYTAIAGWVWMAGVVVLIVYATVSYVNLKRRVEQSSWLEDGLYLCPGLDSAFVLGYVKPRIYLPQGLDGDALRYVVAHERAHIARKDHIWKLFG